MKTKYQSLCEEIIKHNHNYYNLSNPSITDSQFDQLFNELLRIELQFPEFITPDSPSQKVGSFNDNFISITHKKPLLSLEKAQNEQDLRQFLNKFKGQQFSITPKLDGLSIKDIYENTKKQLSVTRGDGESGEDITGSLNFVKSSPKRINYNGYLEVRGEAIIPIEKFNEIQGDYKTPRNLVSGTIQAKDGTLAEKRGVEIIYYDIVLSDNEFTNEIEVFKFLKDNNFPVPEHIIMDDAEEIIQYCLNFDRTELAYEIDGLVIKVVSFSVRESVGQTSHHPRWGCAFKFPSLECETTLKDITWQVGRTGVITPVFVLEEVLIGDVSVGKCTGHNIDFLNNFKLNDQIIIKRSNDVIPYAIPQPEKRNGKERDIEIPEYCPVCKSETVIKLPFLYCTNKKCSSRVIEGIIHFAKRDCMDIENLGDVVAGGLVNNNLINDISDIYILTKKDLLMLPLFASKKANNLLEAIENSRSRDFNKLIYALGIPNIGKNGAKLLANRYKSMDNLIKANINELLEITDIGEITANSVVEYFENEENLDIFNRLKEYGVNMEIKNKEEKKVGNTNSVFNGKKVYATGTFAHWKKEEIKALLESLGAEFASGYAKSLDYLIEGSLKSSAKVDKAHKDGIVVIGENEFLKMVG
jgi:DNA ligase (NAD+)